MNRAWLLAAIAACAWMPGTAAAGPAQVPRLDQIRKRAEQLRELQITEYEERKLGEAISEKIRVRYGVVQDAALHRYVSLVGLSLAQATSRPNLPWTFVVLDTDGVNAFAAPGGYVHVTRGALGLIASEAELAAVLAHEIVHVVDKHTVEAIQKGKLVQMAADETVQDQAVWNRLVDQSTEVVLAGFGRKEELESDAQGVRLANRVGYDPRALGTFLGRLTERNKAAAGKQGLFASHPEMKERLDRLARQVAGEKLDGTASLADRYRRFVSYTARPQAEVAVVVEGAAGLTGSAPKAEEKPAPKKRGFGLANLLKPTGGEKKSAEVTGSGASRGVDTERNAVGGPVSALVAVKVTPADLAAFKREGQLR